MHQFPLFIKVDEIGPYRLPCQDEFDMITATENLLINNYVSCTSQGIFS